MSIQHQSKKIKNSLKYTIIIKTVTFFIITFFLSAPVFSQIKFSNGTKKYIEYSDSITVFKNALLTDGKGTNCI